MQESYYVGLDVHKRKISYCLMEADGKRWTPSVGPLGGISKVDSAVVVAASKGNSERGRA